MTGSPSLLRTRLFTVGIVLRSDKVLVLRRREDDDTYPGLWDSVGGHFEKDETAELCMLREVREESALRAKILKVGNLIEYRDEYGRSLAVPFLLASRSGVPVLSEHDSFRWVTPGDARTLDAVPSLGMALDGFLL